MSQASPRAAVHRHLAILDGTILDGAGEVSAESDVAADEVLHVGDLAKVTGKTVRAIHLYEELGLLRPVDRTKGRYRLFNRDSVNRVRWITKFQALGLSLTEIQELLRDHDAAVSAKEAADRLRDVFVEKLSEVQSKLNELRRLERELVASLTYLEACQSACGEQLSVQACPKCDRHADQPHAPELVAGVLAHSNESAT